MLEIYMVYIWSWDEKQDHQLLFPCQAKGKKQVVEWLESHKVSELGAGLL